MKGEIPSSINAVVNGRTISVGIVISTSITKFSAGVYLPTLNPVSHQSVFPVSTSSEPLLNIGIREDVVLKEKCHIQHF